MNNNKNTSIAREILIVAFGLIALLAIVIVVISSLVYKFFERLTPAGRMDALVILTWGVPIAFMLGIVLGMAYVRGFKLGREHSEKILTSSRPNETPAYTPPTVVLEPYDRLPTEFATLSPEMNARILKALNSGNDEVNA